MRLFPIKETTNTRSSGSTGKQPRSSFRYRSQITDSNTVTMTTDGHDHSSLNALTAARACLTNRRLVRRTSLKGEEAGPIHDRAWPNRLVCVATAATAFGQWSVAGPSAKLV